MVRMPVKGEVVKDESALRALYEGLHLGEPLPDHEPDRYARAAGFFQTVIKGGKRRGMVGIYNREDLDRARRNAERLAWARDMVDQIVRDAEFWAGFSDETLYAMVPTQNPMALTVAQYDGCPIHGGNRSTLESDMLHPYQWRCNIGGEWWYQGIEVENPGTGARVRVVDDGQGWVAPEGFMNAGVTYYFTGAYRCYLLYRLFSNPYAPQTGTGHQGRPASQALALAYAFTGERKYAHKAGVLLNRLAQVYGRLQGIKEGYEAYDRSKDPIRGYVGEASGREQFFLNHVAVTYDLIFEAMLEEEDVAGFFRARGGEDFDGDGRVTAGDIIYNIHRNLFAYAYEFLDRTLPIAGGDFLTSSLYSLLKVGACLQNGAMIRQALEAPTGLYNVMSNSFFRDGKFWYDSISYSTGNIREALDAAEWTLGFHDGAHFPSPVDLYHDPRFRLREMMEFARAVDCDGRVPMIGDTGGGRNSVLRTPYSLEDEIGLLRLPEARDLYVRRLLAAAAGDPDAARKGGDLFLLFHCEPWNDTAEAGTISPESDVLHDSGFCILRAGDQQASRRHVVLNYGKGNHGHGHMDKLAVNVIAYGYDLSADLGYPPSWVAPKKAGWETHTASHCTAVIDGQNQVFATGSLNLFVPGPWVHMADASGERAYPGLANLYRRAVALVPVDEKRAYVVDWFRIAGGAEHDYSFHSWAGENAERFEIALAEDAVLEAQDEGTLAGPGVPFGEAPGYGFVKDVARARTDGGLTATWRTEEEGAGIRLHMPGEADSTVITGLAEGTGLQGHSPWDRSVIVRRSGPDGKENRFMGVLEPFSGATCIDKVATLCVGGRAAGLRVEIGKRVHYIVYGADGVLEGEADSLPFRFEGDWAFVEREGDVIRRAQVVNGKAFRFGKIEMEGPGGWGGRVDAVDIEDRRIVVTSSVPLPVDGSLIGRTIVLSHPDYICNSSYEVAGVEVAGEDRYRISLDKMDFLLSEGRIEAVEGATLLTDTPMLKLEVVRDLFDGKTISNTRGQTGPRLKTAEKGKLMLADTGEAAAFSGKPFYVYDVAPGDSWRIADVWHC